MAAHGGDGVTDLERTIADHRAMYRDELDFPPSQQTPPVAFTYSETERAMVPDDRPLVINPFTADAIEVPDSATQSTQVGMPMSAAMLRYLLGPTPSTPWATSLKTMRAWCRREHRYHRTPKHWRGSLCWQLVYTVVIGKPLGGGPATIHEAALILQYDDPEPVLRAALQYIEDNMDKIRVKQEQRAKEDAGLFLVCQCSHGWARHDNPATTFACDACNCRRYSANARAA